MRYVFGVMLALSGPVAAQEVDCANPVAQVEMTFCAEADWQAADVSLNAAYKDAMAVLKGVGGADFLRQAQRDWISFRDNACAAEGYLMHGGSAEPMLIYSCRARLTQQRTEDLSYITGSAGE